MNITDDELHKAIQISNDAIGSEYQGMRDALDWIVKKRSTWMPIEWAPKNGRWILATKRGEPVPSIMRWISTGNPGDETGYWDGDKRYMIAKYEDVEDDLANAGFTHFQYLPYPEPPK